MIAGLDAAAQSAILTGSTPVAFRGTQQSARVMSVGINPSIREFFSRGGSELDGDRRRFETLRSLGVESMQDVTVNGEERMRQRCRDYFTDAPYMDWFGPMEALVRGITGASFFDGSAYHCDLVQWATDPLWGRLETDVKRVLLGRDRPTMMQRLADPSLEIVYLNGRTVCEEVGEYVHLTMRECRFNAHGSRRRFYRGRHGGAVVVGCSSNIQEERLTTVDRAGFMQWIIDECRTDLEDVQAFS